MKDTKTAVGIASRRGHINGDTERKVFMSANKQKNSVNRTIS